MGASSDPVTGPFRDDPMQEIEKWGMADGPGCKAVTARDADAAPARRHARGFTLLEMLVVLAVLGLALMLLVGRMPGASPAVQARAAADRVAAALRGARGRAIRDDRFVTVRLDAPAHALRVGTDAPLALPPVLAVAGTPAIRFAPDGSASGGRIVLAGGGRRLAVGVDWLTGRVEVSAVP